MKTKSNLDEMQRGKLLKIEEIGVWLAFWGLLAAVIVQLLLKADLTQVIGEICVFALVSVYLCVASIKNGLWTASIAASRKTNALFSIVPAAAIGLVSAVKALVISVSVSSTEETFESPRTAVTFELNFTVMAGFESTLFATASCALKEPLR